MLEFVKSILTGLLYGIIMVSIAITATYFFQQRKAHSDWLNDYYYSCNSAQNNEGRSLNTAGFLVQKNIKTRQQRFFLYGADMMSDLYPAEASLNFDGTLSILTRKPNEPALSMDVDFRNKTCAFSDSSSYFKKGGVQYEGKLGNFQLTRFAERDALDCPNVLLCPG